MHMNLVSYPRARGAFLPVDLLLRQLLRDGHQHVLPPPGVVPALPAPGGASGQIHEVLQQVLQLTVP